AHGRLAQFASSKIHDHYGLPGAWHRFAMLPGRVELRLIESEMEEGIPDLSSARVVGSSISMRPCFNGRQPADHRQDREKVEADAGKRSSESRPRPSRSGSLQATRTRSRPRDATIRASHPVRALAQPALARRDRKSTRLN